MWETSKKRNKKIKNFGVAGRRDKKDYIRIKLFVIKIIIINWLN